MVKTVLIISETESFYNIFANQYGFLPVHFSWARSIDQADELILSEKPAYLFLISTEKDELLKMVRAYNERHLVIPFICFSSPLGWQDREKIWTAGATDFVSLPILCRELEYILKNLIEYGQAKEYIPEKQLDGNLADFDLLNLVHIFEKSGKTGLVRLRSKQQQGEVYFEKGKIINAGYAGCDPLEAVTILASWRQGSFTAVFERIASGQKILLDNQQVVQECRNYRRRENELRSSLPEENALLFTSPNINYDEFIPEDIALITRFNEGCSLADFLNSMSGNTLKLLKKIQKWYIKGWLLNESRYRLVQDKLNAEAKSSPLKKLYQKIFTKSDSEEFSPGPVRYSMEEDLSLAVNRRENRFNRQFLIDELLENAAGAFNENT